MTSKGSNETIDLACHLTPPHPGPLEIPASLLDGFAQRLTDPAELAALHAAYHGTAPRPWPRSLSRERFETLAPRFRRRCEADLSARAGEHLVTSGVLTPSQAQTLAPDLMDALGRLLAALPCLEQRLEVEPPSLAAFLDRDLPCDQPAQRTPAPASDGSRHHPGEWWAAIEEPRPQRRRRPPASRGLGGARLAKQSDLAELLCGRGPNDTRLPGFAPIVEQQRLEAQGREALPGARILPERVLHLSRERRCQHMLVVGRVGSGKTTSWILPMLRSDLADTERTVVVIDAKGELYGPLAELASRYRPGTELEVLNLKEPSRSLRWNPVAGIHSEGQAAELAYALCHATPTGLSSGDSPFWINSSIDLVGCILLALRQSRGPRACLADLLGVLDLPPKGLLDFARRHRDISGLMRFASALESGNQNAETISQDSRMRLRVLRDERIAATTARSEFELRGLAERPRVVLLQIHEEDAASLAPLTGIFLTQLLEGLLTDARHAPGRALPRHVALFVEELASAMTPIPSLSGRLNTLRSRNASVTASVQGLGQIRERYREQAESVLIGFSNQVFFPNITVSDAEVASRASGEGYTLERTDHRTSPVEPDPETPGGFLDQPPRESYSERALLAPLLLPGEIRFPPRSSILGGAATFLLTDLPPFQAFLTPSFELRHFAPLLEAADKRGEPPVLRRPRPTRRSSEKRKPGEPGPRRGTWSTKGKTEAQRWWSGLLSRHETLPFDPAEIEQLAEQRGLPLEQLFDAFRADFPPNLERIPELVAARGRVAPTLRSLLTGLPLKPTREAPDEQAAPEPRRRRRSAEAPDPGGLPLEDED